MEDKRDTPFAGEYGEFEDAYDHTQMGRVAKIVAIHAGVSTPSTSSMLTDRIIGATRSALEKDSRIASVSVYALRPLVNDIALASVGGPISNALQEIIDALREADGAIVVTPVFQSSYSGLFKSFFDILPENTMRDLPVVMGATAGSVRHSLVTELAMRPLFAYLKALPTTLAVFAASEDFGASVPDGDATDTASPLVSRINRAGKEFARFIESFPRKAPVDAMSDFAPMESLLKR
ncbi:FMN reductase [Bifidobacterium tsurumiense]|nr:FMN reductase [Bifidobacterium tsurumiense]